MDGGRGKMENGKGKNGKGMMDEGEKQRKWVGSDPWKFNGDLMTRWESFR